MGELLERPLEVLPHSGKIKQAVRTYVQLMLCRGLFCSGKPFGLAGMRCFDVYRFHRFLLKLNSSVKT